jgi:DnaJ-class molecular chaperone
MLWYINDEECVFDSWEELGLALRELSKNGNELRIKAGPICLECNGEGNIVAFNNKKTTVYMECADCNGNGIKH